jgi:hypothetical protein
MSKKATTPAGRRTAMKNGQAMVEFLVGLVAVMALLIGARQVASLARNHTEAMVEARRQAGELAILTDLDGESDILYHASYLDTWDTGPDGRPHTRDDVPVFAVASAFQDTVVERSASAEDWELLESIPENRVQRLRQNADPVQFFGLVQGYDSRTVALLPAARSLIYNAESIEIEAEAWIPLLRGIY